MPACVSGPLCASAGNALFARSSRTRSLTLVGLYPTQLTKTYLSSRGVMYPLRSWSVCRQAAATSSRRHAERDECDIADANSEQCTGPADGRGEGALADNSLRGSWARESEDDEWMSRAECDGEGG